eukprot:748643-Hanusia_phi.AAC.1
MNGKISLRVHSPRDALQEGNSESKSTSEQSSGKAEAAHAPTNLGQHISHFQPDRARKHAG